MITSYRRLPSTVNAIFPPRKRHDVIHVIPPYLMNQQQTEFYLIELFKLNQPNHLLLCSKPYLIEDDSPSPCFSSTPNVCSRNITLAKRINIAHINIMVTTCNNSHVLL